jgi:hypothetical protein
MQWQYQDWGADAVLAGHDHTYERIVLNGFPYFVNGLGGKSLYDFGAPVTGSQVRYNGDYGAMLVEASASHITFQFITRTGVVIDTYTLDTTTTAMATLNLTSIAAGDEHVRAGSPNTNYGVMTPLRVLSSPLHSERHDGTHRLAC